MIANPAGHNVIMVLPDLPPSINGLYDINAPNIHSNVSRIEIKAEWKLWRSSMQRYVKLLPIAPGSLVHVDLFFYYDFYYKNGRLKRLDTQNLLSFAINTVAMKQEWDDALCKSGSWGSAHEISKPRVIIRLIEIP